MKNKNSISGLIAGSYVLLAILFVACSDSEDQARLTSGTALSAIPEEGGSYQLNVDAQGSWLFSLSDQGDQWCTLIPAQGVGAGVVKAVVAANDGPRRTTLLTLMSGTAKDTLRMTQEASVEDLDHTIAGRLEIPRLAKEEGYQFVDHTVNYQGKVISNYSMEYCLEKRHARWVAFTAYDVTAEDHVSRTDAWADDPLLKPEYHTTRADYSGYDRGHLVASNDRRYCREANEQTFYYSNMSPQLADFNQNIWQKLEENVKAWMQSPALRDTLYVVKGGTIRDDQMLKTTGISKVAVPKYYFMAVLARKGESYQAIAFWLEHKVHALPYDLKGKAISVDVLEEKTGIDFFPLLPDHTENQVEAVCQTDRWSWKE